ncbi:hypothetical protein, partial [Prolixibacter bellariivorans]|uniref:hypothetical protein n=1 Tax=Prolixibacter bellariivorans TaxID=314319 RepID=UPI001F3C463E
LLLILIFGVVYKYIIESLSVCIVLPDGISFFSLDEKKESSQSDPSSRVTILSFLLTTLNTHQELLPPSLARPTLTGLPFFSPYGELRN